MCFRLLVLITTLPVISFFIFSPYWSAFCFGRVRIMWCYLNLVLANRADGRVKKHQWAWRSAKTIILRYIFKDILKDSGTPLTNLMYMQCFWFKTNILMNQNSSILMSKHEVLLTLPDAPYVLSSIGFSKIELTPYSSLFTWTHISSLHVTYCKHSLLWGDSHIMILYLTVTPRPKPGFVWKYFCCSASYRVTKNYLVEKSHLKNPWETFVGPNWMSIFWNFFNETPENLFNVRMNCITETVWFVRESHPFLFEIFDQFKNILK